jgi:hypothetical protein
MPLPALNRLASPPGGVVRNTAIPNRVGDPSALPVRQYPFDKYWSLSFPRVLIAIEKTGVAEEQKAKPFKVVFHHLLITTLVIPGSYLLSEASAGLIAKFA